MYDFNNPYGEANLETPFNENNGDRIEDPRAYGNENGEEQPVKVTPVTDYDTVQYQTLVGRSKNSPSIFDQKMFAIQQLVGQLHSELRRNAKFTSYPQAKDFVDLRNKPHEKSGTKKLWSILKYQDYDGDNVPDVIVGYKNKLYSYNGFQPKETDYPFRQAFYAHDPYEKYQKSKISKIEYGKDMYTPVGWSVDKYVPELQQIKPNMYKSVDRLKKIRKYKPRRNVFQIITAMTIENLRKVKSYFKDHGIVFPKGINHMRIASEIYSIIFLEPAFNIANDGYSESDQNFLTLTRWKSKGPDKVDTNDRWSVSAIVDEIFDEEMRTPQSQKLFEDRVMEYIINRTGNQVPREDTDIGLMNWKTSDEPDYPDEVVDTPRVSEVFPEEPWPEKWKRKNGLKNP
jgi:hypothetical protein